MAYFDTKDKKKGLIGTIIVHLIVLILFTIYGLTYPTPRPESGILLSLGSENQGFGELQAEQPGETPEEQPVYEEQPEESNPSESPDIQDLTQDRVETIEISPKKDPEKDAKKTPVETPIKTDSESKDKPIEKEQTIDENLKTALKDAFNKKQGGSKGDDKDKEGVKGRADGDPNGKSTTGGKGSGGGNGGYNLGTRAALDNIKPDYQCEEYGVVVMSIRVDRSGKTLNAKLQLKGSTNTAPCLVNKAKEAAMKTKWQPDIKAPEMQIGSITYHFDLN